MKIKKCLLLYCFKAYNVYEFERRVKILALYIRRKCDKMLIETMFKQNHVTFGNILKGVDFNDSITSNINYKPSFSDFN